MAIYTKKNIKFNFTAAAEEALTTIDFKYHENLAIIFTSNITVAKQIMRKLGNPYRYDTTGAEWYTTIEDIMKYSITMYQDKSEVKI